MMAEQRASVGLAPAGRPKVIGTNSDPISKKPWTCLNCGEHGIVGHHICKKPPVPTFADAGIDKHLAHTARKLAAVPEVKFEKLVSDWRENVTQGAARVTVDLLAKKTHVSNNSGENEWYTPPAILDVARAVMGGIDCDPASSVKANETVRAKVFYSIDNDGLARTSPADWRVRVPGQDAGRGTASRRVR
jgi:hypothetical protein